MSSNQHERLASESAEMRDTRLQRIASESVEVIETRQRRMSSNQRLAYVCAS